MDDETRFLFFSNSPVIKHSIVKCDIIALENGTTQIRPKKDGCHCYWDGEPLNENIDNKDYKEKDYHYDQPFTIPIDTKRTCRVGLGVFCNESCAFAFDNLYFQGKNEYAIRYLRKRLNPTTNTLDDLLFEAPPPFVLKKFGGPLTIEQYRSIYDIKSSPFLNHIMRFIEIPKWRLTISSVMVSDLIDQYITTFAKENRLEHKPKTNNNDNATLPHGMMYQEIKLRRVPRSEMITTTKTKTNSCSSSSSFIPDVIHSRKDKCEKEILVKPSSLSSSHPSSSLFNQTQQRQIKRTYDTVVKHTLENSVRIASSKSSSPESTTTSIIATPPSKRSKITRTTIEPHTVNNQQSNVSSFSSRKQSKKIERPIYFTSKKKSLHHIFND